MKGNTPYPFSAFEHWILVFIFRCALLAGSHLPWVSESADMYNFRSMVSGGPTDKLSFRL